MGQAKRRKLAGTYPSGGPVERFRVPAGKLAITVDVQGTAPSTVLFDSDKVADIVAAIDRVPRPEYPALVRGLADEFVKGRRNGADFSGIGIGILWTALYHPQHGATVRTQVSRQLRDTGKAHITWSFSKDGLAIALADQFVDLDGVLASTPKDRSIAIVPAELAEPELPN